MKTRSIVILLAALLAVPMFGQTISATISLGAPVDLGAGQFSIPVSIMTAPGSVRPQAFCFRVDTSAAVDGLTIARSGVTVDAPAVFEWQSAGPTSVSYLVVYDERVTQLPAGDVLTVAELHLTLRDLAGVHVGFEASATAMVSNQGGTVSASLSRGNLALNGDVQLYAPQPAALAPSPSKRRAAGGH